MKQYRTLDRVHAPSDLKNMSYDELSVLCKELREFIVDNVSQTGGHLASNLGIVELSVALEREFDSKVSRIIYDVGHQSYVHKILTGRRDAFHTLRKYGGLSGFMKPEESDTDPCITGHASSSISVALGMAHARTLRGQKYHVVAVIGDGAMTGGMAYEALNSAGTSGEPLLVVLNDNKMSIARNVGGLSRHLAKLRVSPRYIRAKAGVKGALSHVPGGAYLIRKTSAIKARLKRFLLPNTIFEQMGFSYLGPVDGHNLKSVCELLSQAKTMKKPVLLHVVTQKGKGYAPSEKKPDQFHGVSEFDTSTGESVSHGSKDFSASFGEMLCTLAERDTRICAVTAAMPAGTGLQAFARRFPERFFDVGIAEEHAVAMAAGLAKQGMRPVVVLYSTFLQRAYDQMIHDVAIEGTIPLVIGVDRAGIVGADGATHNGVFDVAFLRQIPNVRLLAPSNFAEQQTMLGDAIYHNESMVAVRYPRGGEGMFTENTAKSLYACLQQGSDVCLVSYGIMINQALAAAQILHERGLQSTIYKLNDLTAPIPEEILLAAQGARMSVVLEDVVSRGGMGESVAAAASEMGIFIPNLTLRNTGDRFLPHGSVKEIYEYCGIDAKSVANTVLEVLK